MARGRGRPSTKGQATTPAAVKETEEIANEGDSVSPPQSPVVKRGRGRPPKNPGATPVVKKEFSESQDENTGDGEDSPKKRGRKRKSELPVEENAAAADLTPVRSSSRKRETKRQYSPEPLPSRKRTDAPLGGKKGVSNTHETVVEDLETLPSEDPNEMRFKTANGEEVVVAVPKKLVEIVVEDQIVEDIDESDVAELNQETKKRTRTPSESDYEPDEAEEGKDDDDDDEEAVEAPTPVKVVPTAAVSTPQEGVKRGRGRPRKTPIPEPPNKIKSAELGDSSLMIFPKKQPILTSVRSEKPLTTRPSPIRNATDGVRQVPPMNAKHLSTVRLTTTADPNPPKSSFSSLPQIQQHITPRPYPNIAQFNQTKMPPLAKYLETLPDISQCIPPSDYDIKENLKKLPDRIVLISTELPLRLALNVDFNEDVYLFRQTLAPATTTKHICLLCQTHDMEYASRDEKDLQKHYEMMHELDVEIGTAKFSDDYVFICLPKSVLDQLNNKEGLNLNSPCQYCEERLLEFSNLKEHYLTEHHKEVEFIQQEDISGQYNQFICSLCTFMSPDFERHHEHMKVVHQLKSYKCKCCSFITADENRMRTHFKARHMLHNSGQNFQCYYCRGLLIGKERLNKHIQQSHMVQTGKDFSCVACREVVPRGKPVLIHGENCAPANDGVMLEKCTKRFITRKPSTISLAVDEIECYFCNVIVVGKENYDKHIYHAHMIWVPDPLYIIDSESSAKMLTISDIITDQELADAKVETFVGHWCRQCDIMVRCYQLYYLHMSNHHRMVKVFQCVISECRMTFEDFDSFLEHIHTSEHEQKTIITHPAQVNVCVYCDLYFADKEKLIEHLISDQHINKFTNSGHFQRTEARNYKCKACFTMFGMKESYIHHLETEAHQYPCSICPVITAQPAARRAHVQNSHRELLHTCDECEQEFANDSELTTHFIDHGFTFPCPDCPKKFYQREKLNAHMEVHYGEIICKWEECDKKIATTSMLVTHYRQHKSNHRCKVCNQAFWNENMLQSHMRSHRPALKQTRGGTQFRRETSQTYLPRPRECEFCHHLHKSQREANSHRCEKMSINKRTLDMANRAALEVSPSTVTSTSNSEQNPRDNVDGEQGGESVDTQTIMILNQTTGELMEITAPINMAVQDVINAMQNEEHNLGAGIDSSDILSVGVQDGANVKVEHTESENAVVTMMEESAPQAIEVEEAVVQAPIEESQIYQTTQEVSEAPVAGEDVQYEEVVEMVEGNDEGSQVILVPPSMISPDGSIMLDPETIAQYDVKFNDAGDVISAHTFIVQSDFHEDSEVIESVPVEGETVHEEVVTSTTEEIAQVDATEADAEGEAATEETVSTQSQPIEEGEESGVIAPKDVEEAEPVVHELVGEESVVQESTDSPKEEISQNVAGDDGEVVPTAQESTTDTI